MAGSVSRRGFLGHGMRISFAGLLIGAAGRAGAAGKVCADPASLDSEARSMRGSVNYRDASPEPGKTCSICAFFQDPADGCGTCQLLNGPVDGKGHCDSWAPKS